MTPRNKMPLKMRRVLTRIERQRTMRTRLVSKTMSCLASKNKLMAKT